MNTTVLGNEVFRTPDERFEDLPDFPFHPHYTDDLPGHEGLRLCCVDEGRQNAGHFVPEWGKTWPKRPSSFLD